VLISTIFGFGLKRLGLTLDLFIDDWIMSIYDFFFK
jgi:hypothetical protein